MTNVLDFLRPEVRSQREIGRFEFDGVAHRLQWNEHPFDLPESIRTEILARLAERKWSDYTEFRPYTVIGKIAEFHGLSDKQVVVTPSSSALIQLVFSAVLAAGDHVVMPSPTYLRYKLTAGLQGSHTHFVPLDEAGGFALPVDELIQTAQNHQAKMVVICAPNNPTGTVYDLSDVARLAAGCGCLLFVDEAYAQFSYRDMTSLVNEFDNVVLGRTFSKALAMAGVRIGYAITSEVLAKEFMKLVSSFILNHFSEIAAQVVLDNPGYIADYTKQIVEERERLAEAIDDLEGTTVFPSGTNFLLIRVGKEASELTDYLKKEHRILINNLAPYQELAGCIRISIGSAAQNDLLLAGWRSFLERR
ncbi:MAG: histidinol-phosphate transaminase [Chloroflexota bacterium]